MLPFTQHQAWFSKLYSQQPDGQGVGGHQTESTGAAWLPGSSETEPIPTLLLKLVSESGVLEPYGRITPP